MENIENAENIFDADAFDFDKMNAAIGSNPFEDSKKSYADERFYKLDKDKNSNGQAIIALVPDKNRHFIVKMFKIETTIDHQWLNAWSPKSIGKPCPFHETYINHWNDDKELARQFKTKEKWVCNVKIIKDPRNPDNEGKIFLYAFSKTMAQKIQSMLTLSDAEIAMGMQRKEVFNPLKGWVLNLKCHLADTGFISYDNSEFMQLPNGQTIYGPLNDETKRKCYDDIMNNTYSLSDLMKPESFMSYDELHKELERICRGRFGIGSPTSESTQPAQPTQQQSQSPQVTIEANDNTPKAEVVASAPVNQPTSNNDLSAFLNSL